MKLSKMSGNQLGDMARSIRADLAAESKRDAKGCDWDVYQRECDKNEGLESEIEMKDDLIMLLKSHISDLKGVIVKHQALHDKTLAKMRAMS